jgi:hypothetical protein
MITKSPIEPDELAILALQRFSTGADVHETNGLIYSYRRHCAFGNVGDAGEAKRTMYRRASELMRRHDRA